MPDLNELLESGKDKGLDIDSKSVGLDLKMVEEAVLEKTDTLFSEGLKEIASNNGSLGEPRKILEIEQGMRSETGKPTLSPEDTEIAKQMMVKEEAVHQFLKNKLKNGELVPDVLGEGYPMNDSTIIKVDEEKLAKIKEQLMDEFNGGSKQVVEKDGVKDVGEELVAKPDRSEMNEVDALEHDHQGKDDSLENRQALRESYKEIMGRKPELFEFVDDKSPDVAAIAIAKMPSNLKHVPYDDPKYAGELAKSLTALSKETTDKDEILNMRGAIKTMTNHHKGESELSKLLKEIFKDMTRRMMTNFEQIMRSN
jgi:hypothetical protein